MTFPVLSITSAYIFCIKFTAPQPSPSLLRFASILRHERVRLRLALITKHLVPFLILLICLFLSPLTLLFFSPFSAPHFFVFLLVSLYPSLYQSVITVMTHVCHTCSAVEGPPWFHKGKVGDIEDLASQRLIPIKKYVRVKVAGGMSVFALFTWWSYLICNINWKEIMRKTM